MQVSLQALVADILDYAGLFPPARLELDHAIRNFARYRHDPEAWMLARFVCPTLRLEELLPYVDELFHQGPALRLSLLGRGGGTTDQFLDGMRDDLRDIALFRARTGERTAVEALEVRIPGDATEESKLVQLLDTVSRLRADPLIDPFPIFCEAPPQAERGPTWSMMIRAIARHRGEISGTRNASKRVGLKLRCGGMDAAAIPSTREVASAIWSACVAQVTMKFTAGLHEPLCHHDEVMQADMHGFLNVFGATVLAASNRVNEDQVRMILTSQDADSFEFSEDFMSWNGNRVTLDEIANARRETATSFGSCSFDEPRDGLRNLGLL